MIYYQKWQENTFEYDFLNKIKKVIEDKPNYKIYLGFDYGFFSGINIYYGTNKKSDLAFKLYDLLNKQKVKIRLICNISYDFDLIVLFGYTNNIQEIKNLKKYERKILKALTLI